MSPEEIIDAYNVVAQDVRNNAANNAAAIGNSQRSIGTYASNVASPSGQTNGLANYTYNRVMRPTVDTKAAALTTAGKSAALERLLQTQLLAAKGAYEDAKNAYSLASTNYTTKINSQNSSNGNNYSEDNGTSYNGNATTNNSPAGTIVSTEYDKTKNKWIVVVSDGNGGYNNYEYDASSADDAVKQHNHNYHSDGTETSAIEKYIDTYVKNPTTILQGVTSKLKEYNSLVSG